eukprot:1161392-Pelagomonas_calceolata.AAC.19
MRQASVRRSTRKQDRQRQDSSAEQELAGQTQGGHQTAEGCLFVPPEQHSYAEEVTRVKCTQRQDVPPEQHSYAVEVAWVKALRRRTCDVSSTATLLR